MAQIQGHCDDKFQEVQKLFEGFLETGEELGASITVNLDGKDVIDIWGGKTPQGQPWQSDTVVNVWSSSKTVIALAALVLIDRGLVEVDGKVAKYWPEFGQNGKQDITIRQIMSHTSGVSGWDDKLTMEDMYDWDTTVARLAKQAPWWTPGTASGYHSTTMGFLIGEVVRRTTGKTLAQFIVDEIAKPLGADFSLGVDPDRPTVSDIVPPPPASTGGLDFASIDPESVAIKTFTNPPMGDIKWVNSDAWRRAEIGAANGHTNARALTRILSVISLGGEVDGIRLLSPETIKLIWQEQAFGKDLVTGQILRFGTGFGLTGKDTDVTWIPEGKTCFWGGFGGSVIIADTERRLTIGYAMNKMAAVGLGSNTSKTYVKAVYDALGVS